MSLLDELKTKRQDAIENVAAEDLDIEATNLTLAEHQRVRAFWVAQIHDLDKAISALAPTTVSKSKGEGVLLDDVSRETSPVQSAPDKDKAQQIIDIDPAQFPKPPEGFVAPPMPPLEDYEIFGLEKATGNGGGDPDQRCAVAGCEIHGTPPVGFMKWSTDPLQSSAPKPADNDTVICWMGGGDYVGPLLASEFDWYCEPDPILAYQIVKTSADAERIEDASQGTPSTEQTEHDRPKLTNEEFESLEKIDGVLDAEPSPILRSEVPPAATTYLAPSGDEFATVNGQTHLIVSDEAEAQGQAETPERDAYAPIHNEDEPSDAAVFAHGLNVEIDQKAEPKRINIFGIEFGGGAKKTLVGEGV